MSMDRQAKATLIEFYKWFGFRSEVYSFQASQFGGVIPYIGKKYKVPCLVLKDSESSAKTHVKSVLISTCSILQGSWTNRRSIISQMATRSTRCRQTCRL